ncbi:hypothetical protein PCO31010_00870 [Pandoraea commovens]|uniref:Lipoprotein n=1 Tax=Pandoraea commovens TaxID=2508289 RepID=A0A5E4SN49_9BURK|nr:hypothetical protein PCO31010_00870 [Pandoraea commovens]
MRRLIVTALLVGATGLQGCASSAQTFLLGTAVGTIAVIGAAGCSLACR